MTQSERDPKAFSQALREHGHAFQYATIAAIERANAVLESGWRFVASEAPIALHEKEVHADLIFQLGPKYLVGECKRVNPAYSEWLFARSNYTTGGGSAPVLVEELFIEQPTQYRPHVRPCELAEAQSAYQVAVAVRTKATGEGCVSDKTAITEAVGQVSRAASGFAAMCVENPALSGLRTDTAVRIVPAIFTTARLFTCDVELEASDLATGNLSADARFSPRRWLWFQRGLTASMRADIPGRFVAERTPSWGAFFSRAAVRSVAIVSVDGIPDFLKDLTPLLARPS